MTADPNATPTRDPSARADIEALLRDVPVMTDIDALAVPGFFEDDAELEEFLEFVRADRQANLA
ncbi:MAG: hypothetical protein M3Q98_10045 [Actinomycetota bacterium]|nr:hypothetical protein [Actinomycetota bacterium]